MAIIEAIDKASPPTFLSLVIQFTFAVPEAAA